MTSKHNKLSTPTKPAPVELRDEALDSAAGGIGLLLPAIQKVREAAVQGNFIGTNVAGTAA